MGRNVGILTATLIVTSLLLGFVVGSALAQTSGGAAQIMDYGTNKNTYKGGETATGHITIKNTGSTTIKDISTTATVYRNLPLLGNTAVLTQDYPVANQNIKPGETKRVDFSVTIPAEYAGMSTAGKYDLKVGVTADGQNIGSFTESVTVT